MPIEASGRLEMKTRLFNSSTWLAGEAKSKQCASAVCGSNWKRHRLLRSSCRTTPRSRTRDHLRSGTLNYICIYMGRNSQRESLSACALFADAARGTKYDLEIRRSTHWVYRTVHVLEASTLKTSKQRIRMQIFFFRFCKRKSTSWKWYLNISIYRVQSNPMTSIPWLFF